MLSNKIREIPAPRDRAAMPLILVRRGGRTAVLQAAIVVGLLAWLLLVPPSEGTMMLVPLGARASQRLPALALRDGTRLVATGALPGSLVVYGLRSELAFRLLGHGILTIATPAGGCTSGAVA